MPDGQKGEEIQREVDSIIRSERKAERKNEQNKEA